MGVGIGEAVEALKRGLADDDRSIVPDVRPSGSYDVPSTGGHLWNLPAAKPPGPKTIVEACAQIRTYAVMSGEVGPLLEALRPLRADPHVLFVEPWLEEALDGVPERTAEESYRALVAATRPGDLVVAHGVVAMVVASRCKALGLRALLVVPSELTPETKAELFKKWPRSPQTGEWQTLARSSSPPALKAHSEGSCS